MSIKPITDTKPNYSDGTIQNKSDTRNNEINILTASETRPPQKSTSWKCKDVCQSIFKSIDKGLLILPGFSWQLDTKNRQRILFGARTLQTPQRIFSAASYPDKIVLEGTEWDKCLARKKIELIHLLQTKHNNKKTDQDAFHRELHEIDVTQLTNISAIEQLTNKLNLEAPPPRAPRNYNKTEINAKSVQIKKQTIHEINFEIAVRKCFKTCKSIFDKIEKTSLNKKNLYINYEIRKTANPKLRIKINSPSINYSKQDRISISKPERFISDNCEEIDRERIKLISNINNKYNETFKNIKKRIRFYNFMEKFGEIYSNHPKELEFLQKLNTMFDNNRFPVIKEEPTHTSPPTINAFTPPTLMTPLLKERECMGGGLEPQPENADVNDLALKDRTSKSLISRPSDYLLHPLDLYHENSSHFLADTAEAYMNGDLQSVSMTGELRF